MCKWAVESRNRIGGILVLDVCLEYLLARWTSLAMGGRLDRRRMHAFLFCKL
jgi:hypothetical protein